MVLQGWGWELLCNSPTLKEDRSRESGLGCQVPFQLCTTNPNLYPLSLLPGDRAPLRGGPHRPCKPESEGGQEQQSQNRAESAAR